MKDDYYNPYWSKERKIQYVQEQVARMRQESTLDEESTEAIVHNYEQAMLRMIEGSNRLSNPILFIMDKITALFKKD